MTDTNMSKKVGWVVPSVLILFAASISALLICGKMSNPGVVVPVCISIIAGGLLLVYANKDMKDRIIPTKWWIAFIPLGVFNYFWGIVALNVTVIQFLASFIPCIVLLVLGFIRWLNGADMFAIITVLFVLSPFTVFNTLVPVSWLIITLSFIIGLIFWKVKPEWKHGIPYLVPLVLSYAVFGVFI